MKEENIVTDEESIELDSADKRKERITNFIKMYSKLTSNIVSDLTNKGRRENVLYKKYPKTEVVKMLEYPQAYSGQLIKLSNYLCQVSSNYRRLIEYYSSVLLFNYVIIPDGNLSKNVDVENFKKTYTQLTVECEKYNFSQECRKIIKIAVRDGVFYGLWYENKNSFYILPFDGDYARIFRVIDGCLDFAIDLSYFTGKEYQLNKYGNEIKDAYDKWKKNSRNNPQFFNPSNTICIKADETDFSYSLPIFTGLLLSIYDIEDYKMLQKAKSENDNYQAVTMKMDTDEDGIPKMDEELAEVYYDQAASNIGENVGLIMTPFDVDKFSFQSSSTSERNAVVDAENDFWYLSGTSPLIFGSIKANSSNALLLSVKPDEQIAFGLLIQIQRFFNMKIKKMNLPYSFKIKFLNQSIFNTDEVANRLQKAATYGVAGAKLEYASSIGMSPSDVIGMSFLEDNILKVGDSMFTRPLISSNTLSGGEVGSTSEGRPTNDSKEKPLTDEGEKTSEKK